MSTASPSATSVFVQKTKIFQTKMSTRSIFELETFFWCQKLRLDLLISDLSSEKISEVRNVLKIDRRGWLLLKLWLRDRSPDSSILELGRTFWCQNLRLALLNSERASEKFSEVGNTVKPGPECGNFCVIIYESFWVCSSRIFEALEISWGCLRLLDVDLS